MEIFQPDKNSKMTLMKGTLNARALEN